MRIEYDLHAGTVLVKSRAFYKCIRIYKFGHPIQPLEKCSGPRPAKR
jgi:hypothetical protein